MILSYDMILENLPRTDRQINKKIRKFAQNKQTNKQTDRQTNGQRIQLQRPLLSPVDRRGERANSTNKI